MDDEYELICNEETGQAAELVKGHVDADGFNAIRDRHCSADQVDDEQLFHAWAIARDGGIAYTRNRPRSPRAVAVTVLEH